MCLKKKNLIQHPQTSKQLPWFKKHLKRTKADNPKWDERERKVNPVTQTIKGRKKA